MKFLCAFLIMVTSTAFSQTHFKQINCFEPPQQGGTGELVYSLVEVGESLHIKLPFGFPGEVKLDEDGCLKNSGGSSERSDPNDKLKLCLGTAQEIRKLVPVESFINEESAETVYCEKSILVHFPLID